MSAIIIDMMLPGITRSWAEFCMIHNENAIALDGFVNEGPKQDIKNRRFNFNHHEGVYRPATRATCAQVLVEVRSGLFGLFRGNDHWLAVCMNDCDEDVCTSYAILKDRVLYDNTLNPRINKLVSMEDMMDTFAGAYPFHQDLEALQELAWVFEPYRTFRKYGGIERQNADEYMDIIRAVRARIREYVVNGGEKIPLELDYDVVARHKRWCLVDEKGAQARTAMLSDGIKVFLSARPCGSNRTITVGKMSQYATCDLAWLLAELQKLEEGWGGGTTIIGSPRGKGTALDDKTLSALMEEACSK